MGMWAGIKYALNNTLGTSNFKPLNEIVADQANTTVNRIATMNQYAQIDAMFTRGCVKSVQRGKSFVHCGHDPNVYAQMFTISSVNMNKSVILFSGFLTSGAGDFDFYLYMTGANTFQAEVFKSGYGEADVHFSWQVIEFY